MARFRIGQLKSKRPSKQGGWVAHRGGGLRRQISLTVAISQGSQYNVATAAGNPSDVVDITVTINSGVQLQAGLDSGSLTGGSTLKIINNGTIAGLGGRGGNGAIVTSSTIGVGEDGYPGSDAVTLRLDTQIDNTGGFIYGGPGGGAGGGASCQSNPPLDNEYIAGPGGGGGQTFGTSLGGKAGTSNKGPSSTNGGNGSSSGPGSAGTGGNDTFVGLHAGNAGGGGTWGVHGGNGSRGTGGATSAGGTGGAAGAAVNTNGHSLTWLGGNNGTQVLGSVI